MEVTVEGKRYRTGKLDAFKQLHVARRLAPVVSVLGGMANNAKLDEIESLSDLSGVLLPLTKVIAELKDEDCDYVIKNCLVVVEREEAANTWARVMVNGQLMYQTGPNPIGLKEMMRLAAVVIQENLGNFFPAAQPEASTSQ